MAEKMMDTRIVNKHDTEANWVRASSFVPKKGEIIIYDVDTNYHYERMKIGDGTTRVNALPFVDGALKTYVDAAIAALNRESLQMIVSATQPSNPAVGTLWFDIS